MHLLHTINNIHIETPRREAIILVYTTIFRVGITFFHPTLNSRHEPEALLSFIITLILLHIRYLS